MVNQIYSTEEYTEKRPRIDGIVVYDGDGDGTSAAAIWLMQKSGNYLAITNKQKDQKNLVQNIFSHLLESEVNGKEVGVFDLDAESNAKGLERLVLNGASVNFIDHHTKDQRLIPAGIKSYAQTDSRFNSTTTITYDIMRQKEVWSDDCKKKAAELNIIGLANDGKMSAAQEFEKELIIQEEREKLIEYAKAINYGAGKGKLDAVSLLRGLLTSRSTLTYLASVQDICNLVEERRRVLLDIINKSETLKHDQLTMYIMPHATLEEKEDSTAAYNEFLNSRMNENPQSIYAAVLQLPDETWRVSARSLNEKVGVDTIMNKIASFYGTKAGGRKSAAGFDAQKLNPYDVWEQLKKVSWI